MVGLLAPSAFAIALALLLGGALGHWATLRIHWWGVAVISFGFLLLLHNPPLERQPWAIQVGPLLWTLTLLVFLLVVIRNAWSARGYRRAALAVAAFGVALNTLVVAANGGFMPQSGEAYAAARGYARDWDESAAEMRLRNVKPMQDDTALAFLGDTIPQPAWLPKANVVSPGDLLLAFGLASWSFTVTLPLGPRRRRVRQGPGQKRSYAAAQPEL